MIEIYTKTHCPYCANAKELLDNKHLKYTEIPVDNDAEKLQEMIQRSNRRTVPQIFINGKSIGGFDDLAALAQSGKLDSYL